MHCSSMYCNKIAWLLHVIYDLSELACRLVSRNSPVGLGLRALFLATRPQARTDKSDITLERIL